MSKAKHIYFYLTGIMLSLCVVQCANPISLTGGPRDEQEPRVVEEGSTPNSQTNFVKQDIELEFDEFIDLRDIFNNVIVSPPMAKNPKITSRGKKLTVEFDEEEILKEDATYVINFGEAIRDFTESNILKNYRFVFSTGDYIDSLEINGVVHDVVTGNPVEGVNVMLYDNLSDSVVRTQRPFYFSSTDKDGKFKIENLRADTFKIFALKDANINYLYDQESEAIGFLEEFVIVDDTISESYSLELFTAKPDFAVKEKVVTNFGEVKLLFTGSPKKVTYKSSISDMDFKTEINGDSLLLWYDYPIDTSFNLIVNREDIAYTDTLSVRKYKRSDFITKQRLYPKSKNLISGNKLMPHGKLKVKFSYPVIDINPDSIILLIDSIQQEFTIEQDTSNARSVNLESSWIQDSTYQIIFNKGSITDDYGRVNDSTSFEFEVFNETQLSSIKLIYTDLDSIYNHVIILQQGQKDIMEIYLEKLARGEHTFSGLIPGTYKMEIIKDENGNREWDPGNYDTKRQSERTISKELEKLRENWELEVILNGRDFIKTMETDTIQQK